MSGDAQVIQVSNVDGVAVVCFRDLARVVLDHAPCSLEQVEQELYSLVDDQSSAPMVLDFEGKELPTCHVVQQLLVRLNKRLGGKLKLCNLPPMAIYHFEWNHLVERLNIYPTREEALEDTGA